MSMGLTSSVKAMRTNGLPKNPISTRRTITFGRSLEPQQGLGESGQMEHALIRDGTFGTFRSTQSGRHTFRIQSARECRKSLAYWWLQGFQCCSESTHLLHSESHADPSLTIGNIWRPLRTGLPGTEADQSNALIRWRR